VIAESINDLYTRLQAIPALASSTGLLLGGKTPDPGLTKIPLPAAWVLHDGAQNTQDQRIGQVPINATTALQFAVMLYVPYSTQQDLIANQLPLLESIIAAIHGQTSPTGQRWYWARSKLVVLNPDRLGYHLTFLLDSAIA